MQKILAREAIQRLLDEGKTGKALEEINLVLPELNDPQEVSDLCALKAWAHYRRGEEEYDEAWEAIAAAGPRNLDAAECKAYLAVREKDDDLLMELLEEFPDSILIMSAIAVRARDDNFVNWSHEEAKRSLSRFPIRDASSEIKYTNLINNVGRFFYAKERGAEDCVLALGFLEFALVRYGIGNKNLHHRAEALHWKSVIVEEISGPKDAFLLADRSAQLWERQLELDPENPAWEEKLNNARIRRTRLAELL